MMFIIYCMNLMPFFTFYPITLSPSYAFQFFFSFIRRRAASDPSVGVFKRKTRLISVMHETKSTQQWTLNTLTDISICCRLESRSSGTNQFISSVAPTKPSTTVSVNTRKVPSSSITLLVENRV